MSLDTSNSEDDVNEVSHKEHLRVSAHRGEINAGASTTSSSSYDERQIQPEVSARYSAGTPNDSVDMEAEASFVREDNSPPSERSGPAARPVTSRSAPLAIVPNKRRKRRLPAAAKPPALKKKRKSVVGKRKETEEQAASSGDEYASNLLENYIGQIGACAALGLKAGDVLNEEAWNSLDPEEKAFLRVHLPAMLSSAESDALVSRLLRGENIHFGSPRDCMYEQVVSGLTHPRIRRWRQRVSLIERRHHLAGLRDFHNGSVRRLTALKAPRESVNDALAHLASVGGGVSKLGEALLARPDLVEDTARAAGESPTNEWDAARWRRVLDFRNQEIERYQMPEKAFVFQNPWGLSIVGPLKRGPALVGGRPREHELLRSERPSHVTILCIVRDAASRMRDNRGSRSDICDLLRDSQYLREGATFVQLNQVVSGALDRLHYESNAPVQYDADTKEWCYLHNHLQLDDFETPEWALLTPNRGRVAEADDSKDKEDLTRRTKKKRRKKRRKIG